MALEVIITLLSVNIDFTDDQRGDIYQYGITSLADKRDFLQKGDIVKFQVAKVKSTNKKRAMCIAAVRKYIRATVDSVKGQVSVQFNYLFAQYCTIAYM